MYSSTGDGKTMIKIGGNGGKSKVEPLYSIPIQTTATLNIQLLMQKGNSSSSAAAATDNRQGWQQQLQHQQHQQQQYQQQQQQQQHQQQQQLSHGPVTLVRAPASSAISSTRVNIVAEVPGSRRGGPSYSMHGVDDASSSLGTQTDFGTIRGGGGDTASAMGIVTHAATHSNPTGGGGANVAVGGDGSVLSMGSSSTTQTGSLTDSSSSQYGFPPAHSLTHQTSFSDSASQCSFPDPISSSKSADLTSQFGSSTMTTVSSSSSSSSLRGGDAAAVDDDVGSEYRVFTDANGDGDAAAGGGGGGVGDGERGGIDGSVSKLTQGIQESLGMNGGSGGGGGGDGGGGEVAAEWKTAEEEEEDDDSDSESWEELGKPALPSTFNLIEWNLPNEKSPKSMACSRVIIMKDKDMILMMKTTCSTPKAGNDPRMLSLIVEIADNCSKRLRKMKTLPNLCAQHMDTLPLSDGRTTKDHLSEMSRILGENVGIREVAYRFQPTGDNYIGTFVQGTVLAKRNYAIGKLGVVAVLFKKSKYATVEAFSEQLCEHIAIAQPTTLGHLSDLDLKRLNRRGTTRIKHLQKDQLFVQNFTFDPTIIVAEAARRSFVRIDDFLLFK